MRSVIFHVGFAGGVLISCSLWASEQSKSDQQIRSAKEFAASTAPSLAKVPVMRLGNALQPLAYDVDLRIEPKRDDFQGKIVIEVEIRQASNFYWLHGKQLEIDSAVLVQDGKSYPAKANTAQSDFIGLQFAQALPTGKAQLQISYRGKFAQSNTSGLFKQKDGENWYVLSQFEATNARRAFPCFDEPHWKTPWRIAITHRADEVSASNMPVEKVETLADGMKRQQFATTPALPSYLIALGVGPFDIVDGGKAGRKGTPLRYFVPKGRAAQASYAAKVTPQILTQAENYFDSAFPFAKLDSMVIPVTVNFGAMENAGLITYRAGILLADDGKEAQDFKQRYVSTAAHEIAHQWFGDVVTMTWWNDLWLNESFATWMGEKLYQDFEPSWRNPIGASEERMSAMQIDRLHSTRQIGQPVEKPDDLANAFDGITYDKGGSVLRMFESYLGAEKFRAGVQRYLQKHAFSNASAEDFFAALAGADPKLAQAFSSFVKQPGLPLLKMSIDCSKQPQLLVQQMRYLPADTGTKSAPQLWQVPVCIRYQGQAGEQPLCQLLDKPMNTIALPSTSCPAWVLPNAAGEGYYLTQLPSAQRLALQAQQLPSNASLALINELSLLADAGDINWSSLLPYLARTGQDARAEVAWAASHSLRAMPHTWLDAKAANAYAAWLQTHFGQRGKALGWLAKAAESDGEKRLRLELLPLLATQGQDKALMQEAQKLAAAWLAAHAEGKALPDYDLMLQPILQIAAAQAGPEYLAQLRQAIKRSDQSRQRNVLFSVMGAFDTPAMRQQALALSFDEAFDIREATGIMFEMAKNHAASPDLMHFLSSNWARLHKKLPERFEARLLRLGQGICSAPERAEFAKLFVNSHAPGVAREYAQRLETIDICIKSAAKQKEDLRGFFSKAGS